MTNRSSRANSEETQLVRVMADQDVLGLLVVVESIILWVSRPMPISL